MWKVQKNVQFYFALTLAYILLVEKNIFCKTNLYRYVLYWTVWLRILRRRTELDLVATRDAAGMFSRASLDEVKLVTISEQCQCCNLTYQRPHDGYEGEVVPGEEEGVPQQGQGGGAGQVQQVAAGA